MSYHGHVNRSSLPYQFQIPDATLEQDGVMTKEQVLKLDSVPVGGGVASVSFDSPLSNSGTAKNPVGSLTGDVPLGNISQALGVGGIPIRGTTITGTVGLASPKVDLTAIARPDPSAGVTNLFAMSTPSFFGSTAGFGFQNQFGGYGGLAQLARTITGSSLIELWIASLLDDGFYDYDIGGSGGFLIVVAPGPSGSSWGMVGYAQNGATTTDGLTFTTFDAADTDGKLCAFASSGNVRIRNRLGSTQLVMFLSLRGLAP